MAEMTEAEIIRCCVENGGFETPELNDTLYLHYKGYGRIQNLERYTACKAIYLESNGLDALAGLEHMSALRCLYAAKNLIDSCLDLSGMVSLVTLDLSHNRLESLDGLETLVNLETINVSNNGLGSGESIGALAECSSLNNVDLRNNNLDGADVTGVLQRCQHIPAWSLNGNPVVRSVPSFRKNMICDMPRLRYLDRPVFEAERVGAEAWRAGGAEAERAARQQLQQEKRDEQRGQLARFREWQQDLREKHAKERAEAEARGEDPGAKKTARAALRAAESEGAGAVAESFSRDGRPIEGASLSRRSDGRAREDGVQTEVRAVQRDHKEEKEGAAGLKPPRARAPGGSAANHETAPRRAEAAASDAASEDSGASEAEVAASAAPALPAPPAPPAAAPAPAEKARESLGATGAKEEEEEEERRKREKEERRRKRRKEMEETMAREQRVQESLAIYRARRAARNKTRGEGAAPEARADAPEERTDAPEERAHAPEGRAAAERGAPSASGAPSEGIRALLKDARGDRGGEEGPAALFWTEGMDVALGRCMRDAPDDFQSAGAHIAAELRSRGGGGAEHLVDADACRRRWRELDVSTWGAPVAALRVSVGANPPGAQPSFEELMGGSAAGPSRYLQKPAQLPSMLGDDEDDPSLGPVLEVEGSGAPPASGADAEARKARVLAAQEESSDEDLEMLD